PWLISQAPANPTTAGAGYPANKVATIPSPVGRPFDTVKPEISACTRMPRSLRPTSAATSACPASCKTVAKCRTIRSPNGVQVTNNAAMPTARTQLWGRGGCTVVARCHNSSNTRPLIAEYSDQTLSSMPKWCYLLWCTKHFERNPAMTTEPDLVLTIAGLAIIAVTVGLLIWGRVSPVVAMALVPTVGAIVLGFGVGDLQSFFSSGL